jgi:peptide/nickel transport system permease protein
VDQANFNEAQIEEMKRTFGLAAPLHIQYLRYLENIFTLNLGISFFYGTDVRPIILNRLFNSLLLTIPALLIAYLIATVSGVYMAMKRGDTVETGGLVTAIIFRSAPRFWVGLVFLFVFSFWLGVLPYGGILSPGTEITSKLALLLNPDLYAHLILPIFSMMLYLIGLPLLLMRTSMLEIINDDFIDICRAKGLSEPEVMYKHAARNAVLPVITAFAVAIGFSFGGNVLVETVFSYPGIGRLMVKSVFRGDYPMAQAAFLLMAAMVLIMNFVADLAYGVLDPRVTYD